jgi:hypothetical protein
MMLSLGTPQCGVPGLARISHEHRKIRDTVFVAEFARVQPIFDSALNSGEFSYNSSIQDCRP